MKKNVLLALSFLTISGVYAQENKKEQDSLKNNELSEVTIVGSRSKNRVKTDVPVPVDVFNISEIHKRFSANKRYPDLKLCCTIFYK